MPEPVTVRGVLGFSCIDLSVISFICCCLMTVLSNSVSKLTVVMSFAVFRVVVRDKAKSPIMVIISPFDGVWFVPPDPELSIKDIVPVPSAFKLTL